MVLYQISLISLTNLYQCILKGNVVHVYAYPSSDGAYYLSYHPCELIEPANNAIYLGVYGNYYTFSQLRESLRTRIAIHYFNIKIHKRKEKIKKCFKQS